MHLRGLATTGVAAIALSVGIAASDANAQNDAPLGDAQQGQPGNLKPDTVNFEALDIDRLVADAEANAMGNPYKFAVLNDTNLSPLNAGSVEHLNDGRTIWRLRIQSPNARNVNFASRFNVPPSTNIWLITEDGDTFHRPLTANDNETHGEYWSPPFPGTALEIYAEVDTDEFDQFAQGFQIFKVNLGFRDFMPTDDRPDGGDAAGRATAACHVDVACSQADPWDVQVRAVATYVINGGSVCSGALVNNTAEDGTPLFLTAYHCVDNGFNGPSLNVFWNFENSVCRPPGSAASGSNGDGNLFANSQSGSTFRMAHDRSDTALFELDDLPNPAWDVEYVGWNRSFAGPGPGVSIHHPGGEEKRISIEDNNPFEQTIGFNNDFAVTWRIQFDQGGLEGGSSGSPYYDQNGRVRGVASAVNSFNPVCFPQVSFYGQLAEGWDNGSPNNSLEPWLDPINSGDTFIDALSAATAPPGPVTLISPAAGQSNVNIPVQFVWQEALRANEYQLLVTDIDNGTNVVNQSGITGTSFSVDVPSLQPSTNYNWTVIASNDFGQSFADARAFTTVSDQPPGNFSLASPADGALAQPPFTIDWTNAANANSYTLTVTRDSDSQTVIDQPGIPTSEFNIAIGDLAQDETYTWTVTASNSFGSTPAGESRSFDVEIPVGDFGLIAPANNATDVVDPPTFEWEAEPNADTFRLIVFSITDGAIVVDESGITSNTFTPAQGVIGGGKDLNWTVEASNELNTRTSTDSFAFSTADTVACDGDLDGDLIVGLDDLLLVLGAFGIDDGGDVDGDGTTGLDDLLTVLGNFGTNCN